jgi:hypothetical protein
MVAQVYMPKAFNLSAQGWPSLSRPTLGTQAPAVDTLKGFHQSRFAAEDSTPLG